LDIKLGVMGINPLQNLIKAFNLKQGVKSVPSV
jgi:hypothetical protein